MAGWDDGYVTDVVYTSSFYRETTPAWLAMASLLLGHRPPDLAKPFAYADLGCGNGVSAVTVAATSPQAEVHAFDFNPAHIEFGRDLAARAGLTNIHFHEASFAQIAAMPANALPEFDFIVSHGVLSWISPENQAALTGLVGQRLRAGGLAYLSYNVTTGWASMVPLRALMRMMAEASPERTDLTVPGLWAMLDRLKQGNAAFFAANPALESRLDNLRKQDPRYIAHELLNKDWHPVMFADVADAMVAAKCRYIGSATLAENIDAVSVPTGVQPLLGETQDQRLRETLRDFGSAQGFRRDLYRRGTPPLPMPEHHRLLDAVVLHWTGHPTTGDITFATPLGSMTGNPDAYRPLLRALEAGPLPIAQARFIAPFANRPPVELLQAIALLISGGYAHPALPDGGNAESRRAVANLNRAVAEANANGSDMPRLTSPVLGTALTVDVTETMVVGALLAGHKAEVGSLTAILEDQLRRGGRTIQKDGQPVADPAAATQIASALVSHVLDVRAPLLRQLGVLEG
jgi:SAM-dependent methyltransferase